MKDLFSVKEKTVVITGGSSGIGAMIANGFIQNGAKIYITSRKAGALEEQQKNLSSYGECISIQSDLSNSDGINQFYSEIKNHEEKIDVLINNAGTAWASSFDEFPEKGWDKVMDINLKSVFFLTQKFLPLLKKSGSKNDPARVINIASILDILDLSICCLKSGLQSINIFLPPICKTTEDLILLSLKSELLHTGLSIPIVGIPVLVPVPKKINFIN